MFSVLLGFVVLLEAFRMLLRLTAAVPSCSQCIYSDLAHINAVFGFHGRGKWNWGWAICGRNATFRFDSISDQLLGCWS